MIRDVCMLAVFVNARAMNITAYQFPPTYFMRFIGNLFDYESSVCEKLQNFHITYFLNVLDQY